MRATHLLAAPRSNRARGFTLVELVMVMVMLGVLAVVVLPRLSNGNAIRQSAWRDQVLAALRDARQTAVGHRRLVCASVAGGAVTLSIAVANPATSCSGAWRGPDGDTRWAHESSGIATTLSPAGTLYFQPSGRITSDGAGANAVNASVAIAGEPAIGVVGETGHVE
jgi:prepilin-type N-terminal cleavage/methylation domain-containing protein